MDIGTGIAIAGIWLGVGVVGWKDGGAACIVAIFAFGATFAIGV